MEARDLKILRHVATFRVSLREVLARLFFSGNDEICGYVLNKLRHAGLLVSVTKALAGGRSYYRLTGRGAAVVGVSESYCRRLGSQALPTRVAILWFCTTPGVSRAPLNKDMLMRFFGEQLPPGQHCIEGGDRRRIYHVYVPGRDTSRRDLRKELLVHLEQATAIPPVAEWISLRQYGFVVLVASKGRKALVERIIRGKRFGGDDVIPPASRAHFHVECIPDFFKCRTPSKPDSEVTDDENAT